MKPRSGGAIQWVLQAAFGLAVAANGQALFSDDFSSGMGKWNVFGGSWTVAAGALSVDGGAGSKVTAKNQALSDFTLEADIRLLGGGEAGLVFRVTNPANGVDAFGGYFAGINSSNNTAVIGKMDNDWTLIARKNVPISRDTSYHLKVAVTGTQIRFWVNGASVRAQEMFPKFDVLDAEHTGGTIGMRAFNVAAQFDNITVSSTTPEPGPTYTNQLAAGADPGVLLHEGRYYLYCTSSANGIVVYTSTDLVNWTRRSALALHKDDSWGDRWFWAPEVVHRNGTFYMYYSVDEHLAVATADNPLGPFTQSVQAPMHADIKEIDAHFFADEDGREYLYFVRFTGGNEIWGAELNEDMMTLKESTLARQIGVSQDWERDMGTVNEGPFVLKHKGTYYLTYSANHFESPAYGVGYATSTSPLGPWTKYAYNPILQSNTLVHGAGHHCVTYSPDSTRMFLVYHTHNSLTSVDPRQLAIDRLQFLDQPAGPAVLEAWGPTITPQRMPLASGVTGVSFQPITRKRVKTGPAWKHGFDVRGKQLPVLRSTGNRLWLIQSSK